MIFFNQVDIVTHLQQSPSFLEDLFNLIDGKEASPARRKDAVCFIQQCCAIAKNLQPQARQSLYGSFVQNGLLNVIIYALGQHDAAIRIAGTDILVAMIDHDPAMVRSHIFTAIADKRTPLTDTLIDLLLVENDLGVKAQAADAIKVLLDPQQAPPDGAGRMTEQPLARYKSNTAVAQQTDSFIQDFYDNGAKKLFQPLKDLEKRESVKNLSFNEVSLYCHLVDILMYFVRQHLYRSKFFVAQESMTARVGQLLGSSQKHMKLSKYGITHLAFVSADHPKVALKFFRTCLGLKDQFYYNQITQNQIFGLILDIVYETLPRDNLLNSACLELFEFVKRDNVKPILRHVVECYRQRLEDITYVDLFDQLIQAHERMQGFAQDMETVLFSQVDDGTPMRTKINGANRRWQGAQELDAEEEQYFNTSDDEDELAASNPKSLNPLANGASPLMKPLVDYPDDEEELSPPSLRSFYHKPPGYAVNDMGTDGMENVAPSSKSVPLPSTPPERVAEKRRREEDEEDELGKLSMSKRRTSSIGSSSPAAGAGSNTLRRKKSFSLAKEVPPSKKMTISLSVKSPSPIETDQKAD